MSLSEQIFLRVSPELKAVIEKRAREEDRSAGQYIRHIIKQHLAYKGK